MRVLGLRPSLALCLACLACVSPAFAQDAVPSKPNVVLVLIDDLGYGDLSCFRELRVNSGAIPADLDARTPATPHIDRLASQGTRLTQFYVSAPVCSPSRVGLTTGQFPARHLINSFLGDRASNRAKGMRDFLDAGVPTLARTLQQQGYATAHFGKWHLGGGRDVVDAPLPTEYGFHESLTQFEGLGDRVLPPGPLSDQSEKLGRGQVTRVEKHELTRIYVNRSIDFIERRKHGPFFVQLWLDDVHDAHHPAPGEAEKFAGVARSVEEQKFFAVLTEMDRQIGRLIEKIDELKLGEQTLILLTADNGPTAWPRYDKQGIDPPGSTAGFRGRKWSLYEGGVRMPFIARWTGCIPAGRVNDTTVLSSVDLFPSLAVLAGCDLAKSLQQQGVISTPSRYFDGMNLSDVFTGAAPERTQPLLWEYGRDPSYIYPGRPLDQSPNLAIRDGNWKLLVNDDGTRLELYDLSQSTSEFDNVAGKHPEIAQRLSDHLLGWRRALPVLQTDGSKALVQKNRTIRTYGANTALEASKSPQIASVGFSLEADVTLPESPDSPGGVIVAQGGSQAGYTVYVKDGKVWFTTRVRGQDTTISVDAPKPGTKCTVAADLDADGSMRLKLNGVTLAKAKAPSTIPNEPGDGLDVGRDRTSPVGDYPAPFAWDGTIHQVTVTVDQASPRRPGHLVTRWAADVDPEHPWPEYPRPQMTREQWLNLNGYWDYAIHPAPDDPLAPVTYADVPQSWDGRIVVPFCAESVLSGVNQRVGGDNRLWYRRRFEVPQDWDPAHRILLHFGAVDWDTTVWVNGQEAGRHRGGYDPFTFDITDALAAASPDQSPAPSSTLNAQRSTPHEIIVSVWDPSDAGAQPRGKQVNEPRGIWYTPVTGIWQTVWLEPVHPVHLKYLRFTPDIETKSVKIEGGLTPFPPGKGKHQTDVYLLEGDQRRSLGSFGGEGEFPAPPASAGGGFSMAAAGLDRLWSPDAPHLYDVEVVVSFNGQEVDRVRAYFALRTIALGPGLDGHQRLLLNGKPLFQFGPLDQGWWPDGLYTAPTDEALKYDIEVTKRLGFNMARKHVKVEPARWYYWCDTLGLLVWQDMPSGGRRDRNQHIKTGQPDAAFTPEESQQFRTELQAMIDALRNHPCIVVWCPFNEGWGQHATNEILAWTKAYDTTRLVDGPSGWEDRGFGDLKDMHKYPGPDMFPVLPDRASVLGEYGGLGWPVAGHSWVTQNNWGYRTYGSRAELEENYAKLIEQLPGLIAKGLAAAVYTQTTDVEIEVNGLMTYDRQLIKLDPDKLSAMHAPLYGPPRAPVASSAPRPGGNLQPAAGANEAKP